MKILHILPSFGLGGMEKIVCAIITHTFEKYEHVILSLNGNKDAQGWLQGKAVHILPVVESHSNRRFFIDLYKIFKHVIPDLLMTYTWGATDALWLGRLAGIKHIIHNEHGFNVDEAKYTCWKRDILRFCLYRMSSSVVVVSHELQSMMKTRYRLSDKKIKFIPNGIDTNHFTQSISERKSVRESLGYREDDIVVGFSGRLAPVKNFDLMLEIFAICAKQDTRFQLLLIGDGPEKKRLEHLCEQSNLREHVLFVGQTEHVLPCLRAMDIFLLTSFREQMPLTILEAMSVGLPVVATKVGEIARIVEPEQSGFVAEATAGPARFAQALLSLTDRKHRLSMGQVARQRIVTNFQAQTMLHTYASFLDELLLA